MAEERGCFPAWDYKKERDNPYLNRVLALLYDSGSSGREVYGSYEHMGRRNIANLTIAPTGSISILSGVSSGIEPVFALSYTRKRKVTADNPNKKFQDKQGDWWEEYTVLHPGFVKEMIIRGEGPDKWLLSNYSKSTAHEVDPYTKLKLQSVIQPWIDHSISVTYNLPESTTEEEVSKLYLEAWKLGLKGLTVYRDGCRDGILTTKKSTKFNKYDAPKRPKDLICDVHNIMAKGRPWKVLIGLMEDMPYEVFAVNGKIERIPIDRGILRKVQRGRYDLLNLAGEAVVENITHNMTQDEEAFTRTISWALRHGAKLEFGIEQLNKSEGDITSFAKAIARTLKKYVNDGVLKGNPCSQCGTIMVSEGGCLICRQCGNSKCE
jgi:ribonucleoside-diphosphate reductase alpha chain